MEIKEGWSLGTTLAASVRLHRLELLSYEKVLPTGGQCALKVLHLKNTDNDPNLIQQIIFHTETEVIVNTTSARLQTNDIWEMKTQTEAVGVFS